jgi:hypothetical protein
MTDNKVIRKAKRTAAVETLLATVARLLLLADDRPGSDLTDEEQTAIDFLKGRGIRPSLFFKLFECRKDQARAGMECDVREQIAKYGFSFSIPDALRLAKRLSEQDWDIQVSKVGMKLKIARVPDDVKALRGEK